MADRPTNQLTAQPDRLLICLNLVTAVTPALFAICCLPLQMRVTELVFES